MSQCKIIIPDRKEKNEVNPMSQLFTYRNFPDGSAGKETQADQDGHAGLRR